MSNAGVARTPPSGLELSIPGIGTVRAARVEGLAPERAAEFLTAVGNAATDATRVRVTATQYNASVVELWAIAQVAADPESYLQRTEDGSMEARLVFPLRLDGSTVVDAPPSSPTFAGNPIVGEDLLVERLRAHNPGAAGLAELEVERRRWVLAIYEQLRRSSQASQEVERSGGRAAGQWAQLGQLVVVVGTALFCLIYDANHDAEIEVAEARNQASLQTCARLYEARLSHWRQTGTMPPASEQERACSGLVQQRADEGWRNVQNAAADVLRGVGGATSDGIKYLALLAGGWFLLSKTR